MLVCVNLRDKILLRGEECKTREKFNFSEKWKNQKNCQNGSRKPEKFSRSRMMKHTSPLDFSRKILLPRKVLSNFETV